MKSHLLFLSFMLLAGGRAGAQAAPAAVDSVDYFFKYHQATVPEKLYLTLDRPYYEAGDTIWFRGSLVAADNNSYLLKSNYIYVELLNRSNQMVMRRKVAREGLCFQHCLPLALELSSGEYVLRAYTSWMRNFDPAFFFNRKLTIYNRYAEPEDSKVAAADYEVSFFPEGGALLAGVGQRIAYKAVGNDGLPLAVSGKVYVKGKAEAVAAFDAKRGHDGMGTFFLPATSAGDSLWCEVVPENDVLIDKRYLLPVPRSGVALQVVRQEEERLVGKVLASPDRMGGDSLSLLLHSGSRLIVRRNVAAGETFEIALNRCRDGVSHLVLATREGIGLSRRLLFHRQASHEIKGNLTATWKPNHAREKVTLDLHLQDAGGRPLRGDYSISVLDVGYVNTALDSLRDNLLSNLLLTSDLRGYIHHPAWYFVADTPVALRREGLDLLMLTHGWCRFATDTLAREPRLEFSQPLEEKEWLSGKVVHLRRKDAGAAISVVDTVGNSFGSGRIDEKGNFFIGDLHYPNDAVLNIRLLAKGANPQFHFDRYLSPDVAAKEPFNLSFSTYISEKAKDELMIGRDGMRTRVLSGVEVVDQRKSRALQFEGVAVERWHNADYIGTNYDLYQYDVALDLVNQMIENEWSLYLEPLDEFGDFHETNGVSSASNSNVVTNGWGKLGTFVIGGVAYDNVDAAVGILERTRSEDVARIEIIDKSMNLLAPFADKAALVIVLKSGSKMVDGLEDHRRVTHRPFGYTLPEYFYHSVYETEEQRRLAFEPDLRKTVYWEPSFQTDKSGNAQVVFYNSDHTAPRKIVVEGVSFSGLPVRLETVIK